MRNHMIVGAAAAAVLTSALATSAVAAPILFDFVDTTIAATSTMTSAFDTTGVGASQTFTDGTTPVTLTTTDVQAPEYSGTTLTGNQTSAAGRAGFVTALNTTNDTAATSTTQMGVNNITISDTSGTTAGLGSNEAGNFNVNEAWLFKFSTDVKFTSIALASFNATTDNVDQITLSAPGIGSFSFTGGTSNTLSDPFAGATIPANTEITFKNTSSTANSIVRIDSFTVTPVAAPEPATLGIAAVAGLALSRRRRRA